jgi:hypothetical protein
VPIQLESSLTRLARYANPESICDGYVTQFLLWRAVVTMESMV